MASAVVSLEVAVVVSEVVVAPEAMVVTGMGDQAMACRMASTAVLVDQVVPMLGAVAAEVSRTFFR